MGVPTPTTVVPSCLVDLVHFCNQTAFIKVSVLVVVAMIVDAHSIARFEDLLYEVADGLVLEIDEVPL